MPTSESYSPTKINDWLNAATERLNSAGITSSRLDCLVLLEDITGKDRAQLLAHPEITLQGPSLKTLEAQIYRRQRHEPLTYIRGKSEFYGREFIVNEHTLVPRPESESMISLLKEYKLSGNIIDVGTGSGILGITAALELANSTVELIDIDERALATASKNASKYGLQISIYKSDLLENVKQADVILANLPYVPDDYKLNQAATHEPTLAILGGIDGLDLYRRLFQQLQQKSSQYVLTESLLFQHKALARIAADCDYSLVKADGLIQLFKFVAPPQA